MGGAALLLAQEWQTVTNLAGVDFTGLTPARKTLALKALRAEECSCGCDMKVAECRVKDPNCSFSRGLAGVTIDAIKAGKTEAEVVAMKPLAELDKTWADNDQGAVNFTKMVYNSYKRS